jgi:hypothetical protein
LLLCASNQNRPAHGRGGPSSFSLDEKEPKTKRSDLMSAIKEQLTRINQVRKKLPRCRQNTLARFSDRPLPAFDFAEVRDLRPIINLCVASPSAEQLRKKAGKTAGL